MTTLSTNIARVATAHPLLGLGVYIASTVAAAGQPVSGIQDVADHWPLLSLVWAGFMGAVVTAVGVVKYYKGAMAEVDVRVQAGVAKALSDHTKNEEEAFREILIELRMHREQFRLLADYLDHKKGVTEPGMPVVVLKAED